jgi:hypothetical protein
MIFWKSIAEKELEKMILERFEIIEKRIAELESHVERKSVMKWAVTTVYFWPSSFRDTVVRYFDTVEDADKYISENTVTNGTRKKEYRQCLEKSFKNKLTLAK